MKTLINIPQAGNHSTYRECADNRIVFFFIFIPGHSGFGSNLDQFSFKLTKCILTEILSLAKNDIDRDISLDENDIDRDISLAENDIDREGQQQF